jgi:hypothetical protein
MPSRPRSHQLETESKWEFTSVIPSRWVFREASPDYGIDGQIEVFDQDNKATGLMFLVQLKGTDQPDLNDALSVQFRLQTLAYYRKLDLPVMIILFHAPTKQFFWKWAHEVDTHYAERGQEYVTVRVSESSVWQQGTPSWIETDLTEFREVRSPGIDLPMTFSLATGEDGFLGTPKAALEAALIEAAKDVSDVVSLTRRAWPVHTQPLLSTVPKSSSICQVFLALRFILSPIQLNLLQQSSRMTSSRPWVWCWGGLATRASARKSHVSISTSPLLWEPRKYFFRYSRQLLKGDA